jgi:dihydroorotase
MLEYDHAPFGVIGLETALGVVLTTLYHSGLIELSRIIELLTTGPATAFSLPGGSLAVGSAADVTIFDPSLEWTVEPLQFKSKSRNTPFAGWPLRGAVMATYISGRAVYGTGPR